MAVGLPANWCVLANKDPRCIQGFLRRPVLKLQSPCDFATLWIHCSAPCIVAPCGMISDDDLMAYCQYQLLTSINLYNLGNKPLIQWLLSSLPSADVISCIVLMKDILWPKLIYYITQGSFQKKIKDDIFLFTFVQSYFRYTK